MKPTITTRSRRRFPLADWKYQQITFEECRARGLKIVTPSFRNISRQYSRNDARRDFAGEAFLFAAMIGTALAPLFSTVHAFGDFFRAISQF
ncbi:MAG: hypothetical protein IRY93_10890 [Chthoniobacterales bacterium]|jgi:hypothetical protein|nr:hypothetical protein [Chthoniobacterales bacterium]